MKKLYILPLIAVMAALSAAAQPTFDFENWTGNDPTGWVTINPLMILGNPQGVFQATGVDAHSGTYAMKIVTVTLTNNPYPTVLHNPAAGAFTGLLQQVPFALIKGFPFTSRPTGVSFWYKYAPVGGDSAAWFVTLSHWNGITRDTIAIGYTIINAPASSYTQGQFNLLYNPNFPTTTPDTLDIDINATCYTTLTCGIPNSTLYVDDIFLQGLTAVNENDISSGISLYPNPTNGKFEVRSEKSEVRSIEIYNVLGENVYSEKILNPKSLNLNLDMPSGIYFLRVSVPSGQLKTEQGTAIKKLVIQK
ncbi:MAG: T9SS type A sorting domain-containing protein [Bacteroidetes bacterium]|nr:T9SS type A sorting domain-containing protein [Bacteroidota bacterium]